MEFNKLGDIMIGFFDSGIGGVTILQEAMKILPKHSFIYYSDSKNNPYGDKTIDELYEIVTTVVEFLINNNCKIIVIACNTASANCVDRLRMNYPNTIFVATEPAYKMVHDFNPNGKTLVMATEGTIHSERFLKLYNKYDNHKTSLISCKGLAELIENGNDNEIKKYLYSKLSNYHNIKNVVLGCTHYPLIKDEIREVLGDVKFFDSSLGVARQLKRKLLDNMNLEGKIYFYDSSDDDTKKERFFKILNNKIN